jgi:hypothetical protein
MLSFALLCANHNEICPPSHMVEIGACASSSSFFNGNGGTVAIEVDADHCLESTVTKSIFCQCNSVKERDDELPEPEPYQK